MVSPSSLKSRTVDEVLSEAKRRFRVHRGANSDFNRRNWGVRVVGMRLRRGSEMLDHWLTQRCRLMPPLGEGDELEIVMSRAPVDSADKAPGLGDFEVVKSIGKGGFSRVLLVRRRDDGMLYAMKVISKAQIVKKGKVEQALAERRILERVKGPFVVGLRYAFQSVLAACHPLRIEGIFVFNNGLLRWRRAVPPPTECGAIFGGSSPVLPGRGAAGHRVPALAGHPLSRPKGMRKH